jgi:hypothetical protein
MDELLSDLGYAINAINAIVPGRSPKRALMALMAYAGLILWAASLSVHAAPPAPRIYSVADYGAVPGDWTKPIDPAIRAIFTDATATDAAGQAQRPIRIEFPPGDWWEHAPLHADRDNLTIAGAGRGLTTLTLFPPPGVGYGGPVLLGGLKARPTGKAFDAPAHLVSADGLDATAGKRLALRTGPDMHVGLWAGAAAHGAGYWGDPAALTIAFAVDNRGKVAAPGPLFGLTDRPGGAGPWRVTVFQPGVYRLELYWVNPDGTEGRGEWYAGVGSTTGLDRVVWQVDLDAGAVIAGINGKQARVVAGAGVPARFRPNPGRRLVKNELSPFMVGAQSRIIHDRGNTPDRTICGLWVGRSLLYRDAGIGQALARLDGKPITDANLLFDKSSGCVFHLTLQDDGTSPIDGRIVHYHVPVDPTAPVLREGRGFGLWFYSGNLNLHNGLTVRDLSLRNVGGYGQGIALGPMYNVRISDVECTGGWHGIGSLPSAVCYPVTLRDVKAEGYDAGYYGFWQILHADGLDAGYAGTTAVRLESCRATIRNLLIYAQDRGEYTIAHHAGGLGGGQLILDDVQLDNEGQSAPTRAFVMMENGSYLPQRLTLQNATIGTANSSAVVIELRDWGAEGPGHRSARVDVEAVECDVARPWKAVVSTDGLLWKGKVERPAGINPNTPDAIHTGKGNSNVVVISP